MRINLKKNMRIMLSHDCATLDSISGKMVPSAGIKYP